MTGWLLTDALPWIIGGAGALLTLALGIGAVRRDAKSDQRQKTALEAAERMAATRQRMDTADEAPVADDPAVLRDWLRVRGSRSE